MNPNVSPTFISGTIHNCSLPKYIFIKYINCVIDLSVNSIGLISTVNKFIDKYRMTSVLPDLQTADFKELLKLLLYILMYI